jgi:hypothetical protein
VREHIPYLEDTIERGYYPIPHLDELLPETMIAVQTSGKFAYLQIGSSGQPMDLAPAPMTA